MDRLARAPGFYVRADTVVRWQRKRFRRFWARRSRVNQRDRGRPATAVEIRRLIEKGGEPEDFAIFRCRWLLRASSLHFAAATAGSRDLETEIRELNGQPALVFYDEGGGGFAAFLLAIADDRIHRVFFHADLDPCITWDRETRAPERHNPRRCPVFHSESNTMTRERSIYLDSTGLVCGVMAFSAVNFNLANPPGPMKGTFLQLGYARGAGAPDPYRNLLGNFARVLTRAMVATRIQRAVVAPTPAHRRQVPGLPYL